MKSEYYSFPLTVIKSEPMNLSRKIVICASCIVLLVNCAFMFIYEPQQEPKEIQDTLSHAISAEHAIPLENLPDKITKDPQNIMNGAEVQYKNDIINEGEFN